MSGAPASALRIDLPRLARRAWTARVPLVRFHAAVLAVSVLAALLLPRVYVSSVTLVPAPKEAMTLDLTGVAAGLSGTSLSLAGPTPQDELKRVVASRAVADSMVDRFGLVERWKLKRRAQARMRLAERTTVTTPRSGELTVAVEAERPELAQAMAAAFADLARGESVRLKTSLASQRARYLEERLRDAEREITVAAAGVRAFEETHGAVALPDQARETMDAAGTLQAHIALLETELAALRRYFTDASPDVAVLKERIAELRRQSTRLVREGGTLLVSGEALPALREEYVRRHREHASRIAVADLLRRVYEQARVDEANPVAAFSVLDAAELPERHTRPKRALIVMLSLALAFAASLAWLEWRGAPFDARIAPSAEGQDAGPDRRAA